MIFHNPSKLKIFIRPGITDMRKSWNGLYSLVKNEMKKEPLSPSIFVFCGRSGKLLKILYWDGNGFCIWQKKLEEGKFYFPVDSTKEIELSARELKWLLSGIDFRKAHKSINFS